MPLKAMDAGNYN